MTVLQANCPACGAPVVFKTGSSVVIVCDYCNSVVARTDRALEDLGKVADVVESGSPLAVGLKGVCRGVAFELTGRAQLGHAAGGTWDEWYAAFADGRWGWLAEAQGRFYLTFQRDIPAAQNIPPLDALELGQQVPSIPTPTPLVVAEKGEARTLAAEGEIPYRLTPGEAYAYADLSGQDGLFGTIDYGEQPPLVFIGREVTLDELGVVASGMKREREARRVTAAQLNCPRCAGPLELRAPDKAERVTCPNCASLLDINGGQLRYLKTLETKGPQPSIPLGGTAEFDGQQFTVIGFMVRSVEFEGVRYFWQEYLLYNSQHGFRWLVESDGHWNYVKAIAPGEVVSDEKRASFGGRSYKIFQDATARAEYVQGEFYWKVSVGELVRATDFVHAPAMLSKEVSGVAAGRGAASSAEEINWSYGVYVPVKQIERQFKVDLPSPRTTVIAPNQPFPHGGIYKYWVLLMLAALLAGAGVFATESRAKIFEQSYTLQPQPPAATGGVAMPTPIVAEGANGAAASFTPLAEANAGENTQVIFGQAFQLKGRENIRVSGFANADNNWVYVEGDLINEETGLVQSFELPIEYYYGTDDGESWSEGGRDQTVYLSALPAGTYTMRLEAQWEKWNQSVPPQLTVRVEQGEPRVLNLLLTLIALSIVPVIVAIRHFNFERRRWADSAFNPYESSESSGGDSDDD